MEPPTRCPIRSCALSKDCSTRSPELSARVKTLEAGRGAEERRIDGRPPADGASGARVVKLSTRGALRGNGDGRPCRRRVAARPSPCRESPNGRRFHCPISNNCSVNCARAGWSTACAAPGGGYVLVRPADEIRIADIIFAVDEPVHATRCAPGSGSGCKSDSSRCLTHDLWAELGNQIQLFLSAVTLADVCDRRVLGISGFAYPPRPAAARGASAP